jgi:hypothetical protein
MGISARLALLIGGVAVRILRRRLHVRAATRLIGRIPVAILRRGQRVPVASLRVVSSEQIGDLAKQAAGIEVLMATLLDVVGDRAYSWAGHGQRTRQVSIGVERLNAEAARQMD